MTAADGLGSARTPSAASVPLAAALARAGATFVVVGGTARHLRGRRRAPRDLDVVVTDAGVAALCQALDSLGHPLAEARLRRGRVVSIDTAWGPLDVFLRDAAPPSVPVTVGDDVLEVARG